MMDMGVFRRFENVTWTKALFFEIKRLHMKELAEFKNENCNVEMFGSKSYIKQTQ